MPASRLAKPPLLVIVTGLPCTGKSALSLQLADGLSLPLISKDIYKESLYETLGWSDREWSKKLGFATIKLLYLTVEELLKANVSLIAETYFHPELAIPDFKALQQRVPFRPLVVELTADGETLWRRWQQRISSGERHAGHADHTAQEAEVLLRRGWCAPLELGGKRIVIDTSDFTKVDIDAICAEILPEIERERHS